MTSAQHSTTPPSTATARHGADIAQGILAMALLGSSTGVTAHLTHFPVLGGQAVRYLLSATVLIAMARRTTPPTSRPKPTSREWILFVALSLVGLVLFNVLAIATLRHADPATLGSALACSPLVLALGGPLVRRSGAGVRVLVAAGLVVGGSILVQGLGNGGLVGTLLSIGVLLCEALFSLLAVPLLPKFGAVRVSAYTTAIAVPVLTVAGLVSGGTTFLRMPTATEALCIAFLGLPLTVGAFILWYRCLGGLGPDRAGLLIGVVPIAASVSSAVLGDGLPSAPRLAGVGVVTIGAVLGLASPSVPRGWGRSRRRWSESVHETVPVRDADFPVGV